MSIYKCKMCGGTLEIIDNESIAECAYCGTKQTLAKSRDEVQLNLFNRANHLRIKDEFDKAQEIYEKIVNSGSTDPEAYWGIVLCKYGIEYVEDPQTYKRVPTCHRTQAESIFTDVDYLSAIENADEQQRAIYEEEAAEIDRLQKGILRIANAEEPFDVFICYKETNADGTRSKDSVLANDIYHQLTQEGLRVFFAAITLEDKLGQEYEPYIYAAINTAKVMLVVGAKPEHFEAVWVKNEWSRYLKIAKNDRNKILIPCYSDMDAYDLPDEFAHLQAQNMNKIGFIQDIIRSVKKLIDSCDSNVDENRSDQSGQSLQKTIENNIELAKSALAAKNYQEAILYANRVLEMNTKSYDAWLLKMDALAVQCEKEQYREIRLNEVNQYGENAVKLAPDALQDELTKKKLQVLNQLIRGYCDYAEFRLGTIGTYFSNRNCWMNKQRAECQDAVNTLLDIAMFMQTLGNDLPFTPEAAKIASKSNNIIKRYAKTLDKMNSWRSFYQEATEVDRRLRPLEEKIKSFARLEVAYKKKEEQLKKTRRDDFWNRNEPQHRKLLEEKAHLEELIKEYGYKDCYNAVKKYCLSRLRNIDNLLNKNRLPEEKMSEEELSFIDKPEWESHRVELHRAAEEEYQRCVDEIQALERELADNKKIVAENRQLFGAGARKRKEAQDRMEELERIILSKKCEIGATRLV